MYTALSVRVLGVPQMVPLLVPKKIPLGNVGSILHETIAAPDVEGYNAIIGEYCASSAVLYG